jgi:hypothetical protein
MKKQQNAINKAAFIAATELIGALDKHQRALVVWVDGMGFEGLNENYFQSHPKLNPEHYHCFYHNDRHSMLIVM